jgi:hypothetical protein
MLKFLASLTPMLTPLLQLVGVALGGLLAHRIVTPTDHQRAQLLSQIANDAAALVVSKNPNMPAAQLLQQVIQAISNAAGVPTTNQDAIARAAAAALKAHTA